jgi:fatty acid/phospholipid biosynthesis enzyme
MAVGVILGAGVSAMRRETKRRRRETSRSLDGRIERLSRSMSVSAQLAGEVSAELAHRATAARKLEEKAKSAEALAAMNEEQAEAVRRLVDASMATAGNRIRSDSVKIGVASFVAGAAVSLLVTLLVHPIH